MSGYPVVDKSNRAGEDNLNDVVKVRVRCVPYSENLSSNRTVRAGPGFLHAVNICNGSAAVATVTLHDNTSAAGDKVRVYVLAAGAVVSEVVDCDFFTGLFASAAAPSASVQINLSLG